MAESKRKSIALKDKLAIVKDIEAGIKTQAAICKDTGLSRSTVATIWANRSKIKDSIEDGKTSSARKRMRGARNEDLDNAVHRWFIQVRERKLPVTSHLLKEKAEKFAAAFGLNDFKCSNGWIDRFKQRHDLKFKSLNGEMGEVNLETTSNWIKDVLPKLIDGYQPRDIYNADETGLFYQLLPGKTLASKGDDCSGTKKSKQRVTLLLGANMDGTDLLRPLLNGKFAKSRCLKNVHSLPVTYKHSRNAWMTGEIWEEWLRSFDQKMVQQKRKVLLFVDNCPGHPIVPRLQAVTVHFLPPNTTAVLQPMDQGVIHCFKMWYKKLLLGKMVEAIDSGSDYKVDVLVAMKITAKAWDNVSGDCIANCFRHAGWETGSSTEEAELPEIEEECEALGITVEAIQELSQEEAQIPTSEECPDEDIVQSILRGKEALVPTDAEEIDDSVPVQVPSFKQFLAAMDTVRDYIQSLSGMEDEITHLSILENKCYAKRSQQLRQSTLDSFIL